MFVSYPSSGFKSRYKLTCGIVSVMGSLDFVNELAMDGGINWFDNRVHIKVERWPEDAKALKK